MIDYMNKLMREVCSGLSNFLVKGSIIQKEKQSQKTSLISYPHDWKSFLPHNFGGSHHSKRILLSMKEYVFDDWESSSTEAVILNYRCGQWGYRVTFKTLKVFKHK